MTAMGLRLEMCLAEEKSTGTSEHYLAILDCHVGERKVPDAGLRLAVTPERLSENRYCRVDYETVRTVQLDCMADSAESLTKPDYKRIVLADGSTIPIEKRIIFVREANSSQKRMSVKLDLAITKFLSQKTTFLRDIHPIDYWGFGDGSTFDAYAH